MTNHREVTSLDGASDRWVKKQMGCWVEVGQGIWLLGEKHDGLSGCLLPPPAPHQDGKPDVLVPALSEVGELAVEDDVAEEGRAAQASSAVMGGITDLGRGG